MFVDPEIVFHGRIVIIAPHMDDEVLGCGGTIANLSDKEKIHFIYVSNGENSPYPEVEEDLLNQANLTNVRMREAEDALGTLGIPAENLHFLGFPDGKLSNHIKEITASLGRILEKISPDHIFVPFRFDRHPDHLAVNRTLRNLMNRRELDAELYEYFIYYRWRLLRKGDIRKYINPDYLFVVDTAGKSTEKRRALDCFRSQTTLFYDSQDLPVLTRALLEEFSSGQEYFFRARIAPRGIRIFSSARLWIPIAHSLEPFLKKMRRSLYDFIGKSTAA